MGVSQLRIILDVSGRRCELSRSQAAHLRDAAAESSARSTPARDLSLVLDRAIHAPDRVVALRRPEARLLARLALESRAEGAAELAAALATD